MSAWTVLVSAARAPRCSALCLRELINVCFVCQRAALQACARDPAPVPELDTVPEILSWTNCAPTSNLFPLTLQES